MGINSFETTLLNLVPSRTILYVTIATKGGSKPKNDLHWNESSWKELSNKSRDNLFPVLVVEIFKVETGEIVTKYFEKGHVGRHKRLKRIWIGFFHPKFPSFFFFFLSRFSLTTIHESQECRRRKGGGGEGGEHFFSSSLPLPSTHPLHRHLDINWAVTAKSLPLHIGSSRTRIGDLWFPSASR